jgi:sulfate adenylyltransferase
MNQLISPYGGVLVDLMAVPQRVMDLKEEALSLGSIDLSHRQLCDLELLLNGGFSPLGGYLGRADYERVLDEQRLADGTYWPWPVVLRLTEKQAQAVEPGKRYALRDPEGFMPAVIEVSELWPADVAKEKAALGTAPAGAVCVGGVVEGVALPPRHDFTGLRLTPLEQRAQFQKRGWKRVLAYQTSNAIHRMHEDFAVQASLGRDANLLLQGVAGVLPNNEVGYFSRVRAYEAALAHFPPASTMLALLPLVEAGISPREVALRAIVARNYGCTHLIVGGETQDAEAGHRRGVDIVGDVLADAGANVEELGVGLVPFERMVYVEERAQFLPEDAVPQGARALPFPAAELKRRLDYGLEVPSWFAYPDVVAETRRAHPPRYQQGFCVFCTGLSGAGKSTIAKALQVKLLEMGGRQVTLLDGDVVRKHLSSELGFSREHRDLNIRRIGYVASEIVKHRGIAICAPIAPYTATRRDVRDMIEQYGGFFEVYVSTPIETCEARDRKGLYAKARAGLVKEFTGVSDPYEIPEEPEVAIDTSDIGVDEAVQRILLKLERDGYLR